MSDGAEAWRRACLALDLLAHDPGGLRGIVLRGRAGPVRDVWLDAVARLGPHLVRTHPAMPEEAFFGGMDVAGSLASGQVVLTDGFLDTSDAVTLASAERCPPSLAARLGARVDAGAPPLILLDEGAEPEERAPEALADRLAMHVSIEGIGRLEAVPPPSSNAEPTRQVATPDSAIDALVRLSVQLGVPGLRAPMLALRTAQAHAGLMGRAELGEDDLRVAAELVLAPRSTRLPESNPDQPEQNPSPQETAEPTEGTNAGAEDRLVEAALAALPDGLLDALAAKRPQDATGSGFGQARQGNRRGRPLPSRPGKLDGSARIDLVGTLRAAAPWQKLREGGPGVKLRLSDVRVRRYETLSDRVVIFAVDASGSAALNRLAEAKGAVELLLADAYARRDHVALVAFRGAGADVLLPPTRSLTQTKRRLAALPGGGGTPLAAGLVTAHQIALGERQRGLSPVIALLTDGRPNIALDGTGNRAAAQADAEAAARQIASTGVPAVILDVSTRPNTALAAFALQMNARYVPLPHATAERMATALKGAVADELGA